MSQSVQTTYRVKPSEAESVLDLSNYDSALIGRELQISTSKSSDGRLVTSAIVGMRNGMSFVYALGVGGEGDFYRRIADPRVRATDKAVRQQHDSALQGIDDLLPQVVSYYRHQESKAKSAVL